MTSFNEHWKTVDPTAGNKKGYKRGYRDGYEARTDEINEVKDLLKDMIRLTEGLFSPQTVLKIQKIKEKHRL